MLACLQTDERNNDESAGQEHHAEAGDPSVPEKEGNHEKQEYEAMEIPEHWLPLPLFLVCAPFHHDLF